MRSLFFTTLIAMGLLSCGGSASGPEAEAWKAATAKGTEAALDTFLLQYPNSSYRSEAEKRIEGMLWEYAIGENTVYHYLFYRKRFPQGKHAGEVEAKVKAIPKDNLDFAALTSKTFAGVIRHDQQEIQVISLKFLQIEQTDQAINFVADINASGDIRKTVPGEIRMSDNGIVFQENPNDPHQLGLMEGRAYTRNNKMLLQSADPNQYWSLK